MANTGNTEKLMNRRNNNRVAALAEAHQEIRSKVVISNTREIIIHGSSLISSNNCLVADTVLGDRQNSGEMTIMLPWNRRYIQPIPHINKHLPYTVRTYGLRSRRGLTRDKQLRALGMGAKEVVAVQTALF